MRFIVCLSPAQIPAVIPINYQYELASWLYKVIERADSDFSHWLHEQGYIQNGKRFKLFCFSNLKVRPFEVRGDRFVIKSRKVKLSLSFYMPPSAGTFIQGVLADQKVRLGDKKSQAEFRLESIQRLPEPDWQPRMQFRAGSPICVTAQLPDEKYAKFLSPQDRDDYGERLFRNLLNKYCALPDHDPAQAAQWEQELPSWTFRVLGSRLKSKKITIAGIDTIGWLYDFEVEAPVELIKIGYGAGWGGKSSMGFGWVEAKSDR